jgi:hypothetical protein
MRPESLKKVFLDLLQSDYDLFTSISPSPAFVLRHEQDPCILCWPCTACITKAGIRACLKAHSEGWQKCDAVLFYEPSSVQYWLVPLSTIAPSGTVTLGKTHDIYRLVLRERASALTNDLNAVLKHAEQLTKGE